MNLIDKDALVAKIKKLKEENKPSDKPICDYIKGGIYGFDLAIEKTLSILDTLEVKEVDLKKLGEIARHLIAIKNHIEDMRLDNNEWLLLEKIGYPERFRAKQG